MTFVDIQLVPFRWNFSNEFSSNQNFHRNWTDLPVRWFLSNSMFRSGRTEKMLAFVQWCEPIRTSLTRIIEVNQVIVEDWFAKRRQRCGGNNRSKCTCTLSSSTLSSSINSRRCIRGSWPSKRTITIIDPSPWICQFQGQTRCSINDIKSEDASRWSHVMLKVQYLIVSLTTPLSSG